VSKLTGLLTRLFKAPPSAPEAPAMLEAMRQARETLPVFWEWLDANQETAANRALKVGFDTRRGATEYMWLTDVRRTEFFVSGLVSDRPWDVPDLKEGDIYPINIDKIADWTFQQDGLFYGHFTTRILAAFDPSMALGAMSISDSPLPSGSVLH
jgi:uncharacterized protein YegJ (DUF2314 family)